ncbi:peroxisomal membrane protein 4 [Microthyrium microscopicum]|uniref:Peroxisomal membrane protein 4 n=1 Tax=Microthyrium microscopicum TaxID=703497 RepID=A0A6A6UUV1_9PEZI|nr:peroxisomal membrane protein 4 [Microthyrium microscopicum]
MSNLVKSVESALTEFILDPANHEFLTLVKGVRNGIVYGSKVRFPHALVMIFLFRSGTIRQKIWLIFKATRQHARNLGLFALLYKSTLMLLRRSAPDLKQRPLDPFLAGLLGGYVVFGRSRSSINQQIVTYVFARVALGAAKLVTQPAPAGAGGLVDNGVREAIRKNAWPVFASVSWASVMWLFATHPDVVQPSLRSSMQYIYVDSDSWDSLRTFLWHNK